MSEASGGGDRTGVVPKELASLVPGFDPSVDNVEIWTSKVELLLTTWPPDKLNELAKRFFQGWPSHCKFTQVLVGLFAASLANTQTFDVSQL